MDELNPQEEAELQQRLAKEQEKPKEGFPQSWEELGSRLKDPERAKGWLGQGKYHTPAIYGTPPIVAPITSVPATISKLASMLNANIPARVATGGALGAVTEPDDKLKGFINGAGVAAGLEGVGAGLGRILPSKLIESAVGAKKPLPGGGEALLKEGLWGTRGGMVKQAANKISEIEAGPIADVYKATEGMTVAEKDVAGELAKQAESLKVEGVLPDSKKELYDALHKRALKIETDNKPNLTVRGTRETKQVLQKDSRTKQGELSDPVKKQVFQAEAQARDRVMKEDVLGEAGQKEPYDEAMRREAALIEAKKALSKPQSVTQQFKPIGAAIGGVGGALMGGVPGAALGTAVGQLASTPIVKSAAAKGLYKTLSPLEGLGIPGTAISSSLDKNMSKLSPEEEAELNHRLLRQQLGK